MLMRFYDLENWHYNRSLLIEPIERLHADVSTGSGSDRVIGF